MAMSGRHASRDDGFETWIDRYQEAGRVRHVALSTLRTRSYKLRWFARWCEERDIQGPVEVDRATLETYQRWLFHYRKTDGQPLKVETQFQRLSTLCGFFHWLTEQGVLPHNPASLLQLPRLPKKLPASVLCLEEVEHIMEQPLLETPVGLRDRAMMEVLFSTGIRRQELVGLRVTDLDLEGGTLWIRMGKGGVQRRIPIGNRALVWLEKYLQEGRIHHLKGPLDEGWMFLNVLGGPLSKVSVTERLRSYITKAGIEKPGACHIFRHTMATLMLEGGADIRYIQEMLGHVSLNTTQIYTRVSPVHLKEVHNRTHPAAKLTRED
jgi:integrase/recombinase XerD